MQLQRSDTAGVALVPTVQPTAKSNLVIAHECRRRLRVKLPIIGLIGLDTQHLSRTIRAMPGVTSVRINPAAISIVVTYDGSFGQHCTVVKRKYLSC